MSVTISDAAHKAIKDLTFEVSASMTRSEGERDFVKEAIKKVSEDHSIDKKILRKLCTTYHKQRFHTEKADNEQFQETYEKIFITQPAGTSGSNP